MLRRRLSATVTPALLALFTLAWIFWPSSDPAPRSAPAMAGTAAAAKATSPAGSRRRRSHTSAERIRWRASKPIGTASQGRLVGGVQFPSEGKLFYTWDPIRRSSPNRGWRRFGTDRLVRLTLRVLRELKGAHPRAPRFGVGDLSRPRGGDFGPRFGLPGHASHQNGLDVDLYYPRKDQTERPPSSPTQIDRRLAQALVDGFVRAGAQFVFVGYGTRLSGPPAIVQPLPGHDNHLHVRIPPPRRNA